MNQTLPIPEPALDTFRFMTADDIPALAALGARFFEESELPTFSTFSPERTEAIFRRSFDNPVFPTLVFCPHGTPEGFLTFQIDALYTVEPFGLGCLFYVTPAYRKSPAGRLLQDMAIAYAKGCGAVAFYNGVMSGVESVQKTMPNLYRKLGFEDLWWGRRILKERA